MGIDEVDSGSKWTGLLLGVISSPEGRNRLSYSYWELFLELNCLDYRVHEFFSGHYPQIIVSLRDAQEWDKLACWTCAIWIALSHNLDGMPGDLEHAMRLLFHQRPDSVRKVEGWVERFVRRVPVAFRRVCEQGRLEAEQRGVPP